MLVSAVITDMCSVDKSVSSLFFLESMLKLQFCSNEINVISLATGCCLLLTLLLNYSRVECESVQMTS